MHTHVAIVGRGFSRPRGPDPPGAGGVLPPPHPGPPRARPGPGPGGDGAAGNGGGPGHRCGRRSGGMTMARQWYMAVGGHQVGPVSEDEIRQNLANGTIDAATLLFAEGMSTWTAV